MMKKNNKEFQLLDIINFDARVGNNGGFCWCVAKKN